MYQALLSSACFPVGTLGLSLPPGGRKRVWQARDFTHSVGWGYRHHHHHPLVTLITSGGGLGFGTQTPSIGSGSSDAVWKTHKPGRLQTENASFMGHRSITTTSLRALSRDGQIPA